MLTGPAAVRFSVGDARVLGEAALARIGFCADDAGIITDQLIDSALCGAGFAAGPGVVCRGLSLWFIARP